MAPQTVTVIGVYTLLVVIFAFDIWRDSTHTSSTISELFWGLIDTKEKKRAWLVGIAMGVLTGHLVWQSSRVPDALVCEKSGGRMECVLPAPQVAKPVAVVPGTLDADDTGDVARGH